MNRDEWMDAIGKINPAYVKEAEQWKSIGTAGLIRKRILPMAACAALLILGGAAVFWRMETGYEAEDVVGGEDADFTVAENADAQDANADTLEDGDDMIAESANEDENALVTAETETSYIDGCAEESLTSVVNASGDAVYVNEVTVMKSLCVDFGYATVKELAVDGFSDYYGVTVEPGTLPAGLEFACAGETGSDGEVADADGDFSGRIYYNEDDGVISDNNTLIYKNEAGDQSLRISVRTKECGIMTSFAYEDTEALEVSNVGGRNVTIGYFADSKKYIAIFMKEGVTFTVETNGLAEDDFLDVLKQLC